MPIVASRFRCLLLAGTALTLAAAVVPQSSFAMADTTWTDSTGDHIWSSNATDNNNWSTGSAPVTDGSGAVFGPTPGTNPVLAQNVTVSSVIVNPGTPAFTISNPGYNFAITGTGASMIGLAANPNTSALANNSSGVVTMSVSNGGTDLFGNPGVSLFDPLPVTLGSNIALTTGAGGGTLEFAGNASAGTSTITLNSGGSLVITAGNAVLDGTSLPSNGSGGAATVLSNGGTVDISGLETNGIPGGATTTLGSLNGSGALTLGGNDLDIGGDNSYSAYSGTIGGAGGLIKDGTNALVLDSANTYSGSTTLNNGYLVINASNALGTGTLILPDETGNVDLTTNVTLPNNVSLGSGGGYFFTDSGATATLSGNITGTGLVEFDGPGTVVLTGTNTYQGATFLDAGTLQIAGASSLGGGDFLAVYDPATLQIASSATLAQNVYLSTQLSIDTMANDVTMNGVISDNTGVCSECSSSVGTGSLLKTGTGTLTLTANNAYTAGTTISEGTLSISSPTNINDAGTTGGLTILNGATLQATSDVPLTEAVQLGAGGGAFDPTGSTTLSLNGPVSGSGSLTLNGTGSLVLDNANTYSGGTTVNNGFLVVDATNALGTGTLTLPNEDGNVDLVTTLTLPNNVSLGSGGGYFYTSQGATATLNGNITGPGLLELDGPGTVVLTGTNTYQGATFLDAGTLQIAGASSLGSGDFLAVYGPATLQVASSTTLPQNFYLATPFSVDTMANDVTMSGNIGDNTGTCSECAGTLGTGSLLKTGSGTLTLSGDNTYSGGTTVSEGTLSLGAANAAGTGTLAVAGGATFALNGFDQTSTGLSGAGTVSSAGGTFTLNNSTDNLFTGGFTGAGDIVKEGSGALVLDGVSTVAGNTTVSGGTLQVGDVNTPGAVLSTSVTVETGATLTGHGTIGGTITNLGGTVQPGGTIGTLAVGGNYTQNAAGTFAVEVNPTTSSVLRVNGAASLAGTLSILPDAGTYTTGTIYPILTAAGGVTGTFSTVTNSSGTVSFVEDYLPNQVDLVSIVPGSPLTSAGSAGSITAISIVQNLVTQNASQISLTPNQQSVLGSIKTALIGNNSALVGALLPIAFGSPSVERSGLNAIAGELRADIATIELANVTAFQNFIVERMDRRQNQTMMEVDNGLPGTFDVAMNDSDMPLFGPSGSNSVITADTPSVWIHGYGVLGETGGEAGYADFQYDTGGLVAGADAKVTDNTLIGGAIAYEHTAFSLSAINGETNYADTYRLTLYGSQKFDSVPLTLDGALGYAFNDYHDTEGLGLPASSPVQNSRHDGTTLTAEGGASHSFDIAQSLVDGSLKITPRVGVEYDDIAQSPYTVTGATTPALNVAVNGADLNALRSTIGAHADLKLTTADGTVITPEIRATYLHDFMDTNAPLTEAFTGAPAAGFRIAGVHPGRDAALAGAGVNVGFSENVSVTIGYDAAVRENELDHTIQVGVKYTW